MEKITLSVKETAQLLGVSLTTIYEMVKADEIPYAKVRGTIMFHRPTIDQWLINGGTKNSEEVVSL